MIKYKKQILGLSGGLVALSILSILVFGIPLGIDFRGGSIMELRFVENEEGEVFIPDNQELTETVGQFDVGEIRIQETGEESVLIRFGDVDDDKRTDILGALESMEGVNFEEDRFESVGPVIGRETTTSSIKATVLVVIMVVVYVAWAFRRLTRPVSSYKYGLVALAALVHDILISLGVFALISYFIGAEVGVAFIAALLTILGYSVNDTIVVFDRIRENLTKLSKKEDFSTAVLRGVKSSVPRSIATSFTTLFVLFAILVFGGVTLQNFVIVLIIGVAIGTYSSLTLAPLAVVLWAQKRGGGNNEAREKNSEEIRENTST